MTEEEIRRRREVLYVLQELLVRCLFSDGLKTDAAELQNFFRVYRGSLIDGIVIDWWKVFGSDGAQTHWKNILHHDRHEEVRGKIGAKFSEEGIEKTLKDVWEEIQVFRSTNVAHLDFNEDERAKIIPILAPLRLSAEVVYSLIYEELEGVGRHTGFAKPEGMCGDCREAELDRVRKMASTARECLKDF